MDWSSYLIWHMAVVYTGFLLDQCIGDPRWLPHPVRLMGSCTALLERHFNRGRHRRLWGGLTAVCVPLCFALLSGMMLAFLRRLHPALCFVFAGFWCGQLLCCKDLKKESMEVYDALQGRDLALARKRLSRIVGRDTERLTEEEVIKAAVETVAENTSDGVIAPFLFMALFGPMGGFFYKAVNTMDSMIGYQNERYRAFGYGAAKLDDLCNFLPSRLAALTMIAGAFFCGLDGKNAGRIFLRDRLCHASPNSGQTESVCAGALHLRLGGPAVYFGQIVPKPYIGDADRKPEAEDIRRANRLLYAAAWLQAILLGGLQLLLIWQYIR